MTARFTITGDRAEAIARSVEEGILREHLPAGALLPPVRALAASLEISPTTVASAYRTLRQRGLVQGQGRRGTRVAARDEQAARLPIPTSPGAVNLADGNPDPGLLPDLEPLLNELPLPRDLYGEESVLPELATVARRMLEDDGIDATSLTVVSGAMDGIERVLATQLRPGDRVGVEDPAFAGVLDLLSALALVPVPMAIDEEGPQPSSLASALEGGVQAVIVTPRAQNPTGAAVTEARARRLRTLLDRFPSVLLIEDDHAWAVAGAPLVSLCSRRRTRWAYLRSMSKALGPDLRTAFLAGSPAVVSRVAARQAVGARWVSRLLQRLVAAALQDTAVKSAVARAEREYARRRRILVDAMEAVGIAARGRSGLNVWLPLREEGVAVQALAMAGWCVAPGERFRLRSDPGLRVTISTLRDRDDARRLAAALATDARPAGRSATA